MTARECAAAREADRRRLLGVLANLAELGRPVPCLTAAEPVRSYWTSEDEQDQAFAARLCVSCAGRADCGAYGGTNPKEFGVYGARTDHERQPHRGRPSTSNDKTTEDVA